MSNFQLTPELCHELGTWVVAQAKADGLNPVSFALVNANGELSYFIRMEEALSRTMAISQGKAYTSARMRSSTLAFHERLVNEKITAADFMDNNLCGLPGGVPLFKGDVCVGAIGISGRTLEQDHDLITKAAEHFATLVG